MDGRDGATPERPGWRIEPHRLGQHAFGVAQRGHVLELWQPPAQHLIDLLMHAAFTLRISCKQQPSPGEGVGRSLVPGQEQSKHFVPHLGVRQAAAFLVSGGEQHREQIALVLGFACSLLNDFPHGPVERPPGIGQPPRYRQERQFVEMLREGQDQHVEQFNDCIHGLSDRRSMVLHIGGEQGAPDDGQRQAHHCLTQVHGLARVQPTACHLRTLHHVAGVPSQPRSMESRLHKAALAQVGCAIGCQ